MSGPSGSFNGLSAREHGAVGALNEDINRHREANMQRAMGDAPSEQVSTAQLNSAASNLHRGPAANEVQFFKADPEREAKRRAGPPAALLRKHYGSE